MAQFQGSEMSPGLFQDFIVFVHGVTQRNEDAGVSVRLYLVVLV